jgi:putative FmdB family regulatory protein
MPIYEYQASSPEQTCPHCAGGFEIVQGIRDTPLSACPKCGSPVMKLIFAPAISTPTTNAEYKNLGFTKLVRRDDGVYENVTRTGSESKYMERDKPETMPHIHKKVSD